MLDLYEIKNFLFYSILCNIMKIIIFGLILQVFTGELKCKESFALIDGRLFLCALAVGVALYALLWDYLYPFPQSR